MLTNKRARLAALLLVAVPLLAQPSLDGTVERARKEFDVPGIAVGIVKDGKVVFARGYGVRRLGDPAPVTPKTLFGIASNTKAFTAAALALLVDEKKIAWDDPVVKHLPAFQLFDPYVTRELTIRDLLSHRSGLGLGAGDLMYFPAGDVPRSEIVRRARFVKPNSSFRSRYAYNNLMFIVAGEVIPAVTGQTWENFVEHRIFEPLQMNQSRIGVAKLRPDDEVASPHAPADGVLRAMAVAAFDKLGPAASIQSNLEDMSRWVIAQLKASRSGGLFSKDRSREMWSAQTVLPIRDPHLSLAATRPNFAAYGLGWVLNDYRGRKIVSHTGGLPGMVTRVTIVPELDLGILVFTNQEAGGAFQSITYTILDHYLGAEQPDWVKAFHESQKRSEKEAEEDWQKHKAKRAAGTKPSLPLEGYARTYADPWYGDVVVSVEGDHLNIRLTHTPQFNGTLEHWQHNTFIARWKDRTLLADAFVNFVLDVNGEVAEVKMEAVSPLTDFSYDFHDLELRPAKR
jgi:CubicO group peptidase (beta-lactamase class C family)